MGSPDYTKSAGTILMPAGAIAMAKARKVPGRTKKKKRVAAKKAALGASDECFTIMPFGGWFDDYYSDVFCPAIKNAGLTPKRADDLYRPSAIVHDIWTYTRRCRIVLADLTGKNPNVFYELGLAHAIAKPAILVAESINDVPFDLRALRVIEYDKNAPNWGDTLRQKIETAIREVLASPLQAVLPSFLEVERTQRPPVTEHQKELIEIKQELELVRRQLRQTAEPERVDSAEDALRLIQRYLDRGMSRDAIIRNVAERGAPMTWVKEKVDELLGIEKAEPMAAKRHRRARKSVAKHTA
jgi:hypothetical protein